MKKRVSKFSFSKEGLQRSTVSLDYAGISLPRTNAADLVAETYDLSTPLMSFGFLGGNGPEGSHPNLTRADLLPKPEDFVKQNFRLISAGIVAGGTWRSTDFSKAGVLKASMPLILGKTVYKDHNTDTDDWVGLVEAVSWDGGYSDEKGEVPAGINGLLAIDAKTNYKVARGVLINSIYSNSVTVEFEWEPSHDLSSSDFSFEDRVGEIHEDGTMIRRIVTKVIDYYETSLVWMGADPFAKLVTEDGKLLHSDNKSFSIKPTEDEKSSYTNSKKFNVSFAMSKNVLSLSKRSFQKPKNTMNEFEKAIRAKMGLSDTDKLTVGMVAQLNLKDASIEEVTDKHKLGLAAYEALKPIKTVALNDKGEKEESETSFEKEGKLELSDDFATKNVLISEEALSGLIADKATLATEKESLASEKAKLEATAKIGQEYLTMQKNEAIRLYKLSTEEADDNVIELFQKAEPEQVTGLLKQYTKGVVHKFGGKCKSCGSDEFDFRSTVAGDAAETEEFPSMDSFEDMHKKYDQPKFAIGK